MNQKNLFAKIFLWMFIGLLITFGTAYYVSTQEFLILNILRFDWIWFILQIGIVIFLSARITKMSSFTAKLSFALYSFITGLINLFVGSTTVDFIISIIGVVIFTIFVAYDIQQAKMYSTLETIPEDNLAIYGALNLYLDFINIFLHLLSIFGNSRD